MCVWYACAVYVHVFVCAAWPAPALSLQEVTDRSERITQLEQEKSALIKQLFEARSQQDAGPLDSTFI